MKKLQVALAAVLLTTVVVCFSAFTPDKKAPFTPYEEEFDYWYEVVDGTVTAIHDQDKTKSQILGGTLPCTQGNQSVCLYGTNDELELGVDEIPSTPSEDEVIRKNS